MSDLFEQYAQKKMTVDWIHTTPWIPPRQMQNAVRVYVRMTRQEKPLALIDTSEMGNGETGLLLTDSYLHGRLDGRRLPPIPLRYMRSLLFVPDYKGVSHLFVDGRRFLRKTLNFVDQIELKRFLSMLELLAREMGAENVYYRVMSVLGAPEATDVDDLETQQAVRILLKD